MTQRRTISTHWISPLICLAIGIILGLGIGLAIGTGFNKKTESKANPKQANQTQNNPSQTTQVSTTQASPPPTTIPTPPVEPTSDPNKMAVIILTGTWSAYEQWPLIVQGRTSFASNLKQTIEQTQTYTLTIDADAGMLTNDHNSRVENAERIAEKIDELGKTHGKISLIGHSHGGNVALLAAGLTQTPIDTIICLSTPHVMYRAWDAHYKAHHLPVYCPPQSRENTQHIITIVPSTDRVVDRYAAYATGVPATVSDSIIKTWEQKLGPLRPARGPNPIQDLLGRVAASESDPNLRTSGTLIDADYNLTYQATTGGQFTIDAHNASHASAMGHLVGQILRDGPTDEHINAIETFTQTPQTDVGWPQ